METEIKLRVDSIARIEQLLTGLGFSITKARVFEINLVFDTPDGALRREQKLLRLRQAGSDYSITFKGPPEIGGRHKSRPEAESNFSDFAQMHDILEGLGFSVAFRYEKYRTEYSGQDKSGVVTVDETPIGDFLELEGDPDFIDATAHALGFSQSDYITASYGKLYLDCCAEQGVEPGNMVFSART